MDSAWSSLSPINPHLIAVQMSWGALGLLNASARDGRDFSHTLPAIANDDNNNTVVTPKHCQSFVLTPGMSVLVHVLWRKNFLFGSYNEVPQTFFIQVLSYTPTKRLTELGLFTYLLFSDGISQFNSRSRFAFTLTPGWVLVLVLVLVLKDSLRTNFTSLS